MEDSEKFNTFSLGVLRKRARDLTRLLERVGAVCVVLSAYRIIQPMGLKKPRRRNSKVSCRPMWRESAAIVKAIGRKSREKRKAQHDEQMQATYRKVMFYDKTKIGRALKVCPVAECHDGQKANKKLLELKAQDVSEETAQAISEVVQQAGYYV